MISLGHSLRDFFDSVLFLIRLLTKKAKFELMIMAGKRNWVHGTFVFYCKLNKYACGRSLLKSKIYN